MVLLLFTSNLITTIYPTAALIIAQMLGAGVLGLPAAIKLMGWVPSIILMGSVTVMSIYGEICVWIYYI